MIDKIKYQLFLKHSHIAPLVVFRIVFCSILFLSTIRFMAKGWVYDLYVAPKFYFTYYGFEWIKPLSETWMYGLFILLAISFLFQAFGLFYRIASIFSFLAFSYIELIDKTNYLNHYYFVSIVCFLLIFLPAHRYFSLDTLRNPNIKRNHIVYGLLFLLQLQLAIVYFFAGVAKVNYDWLINAMPLQIWLPSKSDVPFIGSLFEEQWTAYVFSWFGAIYDLIIPFLMWDFRTRKFAYVMVIVFHLLTALLFPIGVFPFVMIGSSLIFFSENFHKKLISFFQKSVLMEAPILLKFKMPFVSKFSFILISLFILIQLAIPMRYLLYPGNLFWNEEGYRFSWRVMLMEKAGYGIFHIEDPKSGRSWEVNNYDYLTPNQEKMMSTQADMILQYAHFLKEEIQNNYHFDPIITAEVYVSLNGEASRLFIDPTIDLTKEVESLAHKQWIIPHEKQLN